MCVRPNEDETHAAYNQCQNEQTPFTQYLTVLFYVKMAEHLIWPAVERLVIALL